MRGSDPLLYQQQASSRQEQELAPAASKQASAFHRQPPPPPLMPVLPSSAAGGCPLIGCVLVQSLTTQASQPIPSPACRHRTPSRASCNMGWYPPSTLLVASHVRHSLLPPWLGMLWRRRRRGDSRERRGGAEGEQGPGFGGIEIAQESRSTDSIRFEAMQPLIDAKGSTAVLVIYAWVASSD
jgi:hypothetical protein